MLSSFHPSPFCCRSFSFQPIQVPVFTFKDQSSHVYSPRNVKGKWVLSQSGMSFLTKCIQREENEPVISSYADDGNTVESTGNGSSPSSSLLSLLCPLLKLFSGGDPSKERNYFLEETTSSLSTLARLPWGSKSLYEGQRANESVTPPILLQLYEFEACPFCRRVREALSELDLSVEVFPCPKGSVRHRKLVRKFGGKDQFPFLIDPNNGIQLYESDDQIFGNPAVTIYNDGPCTSTIMALPCDIVKYLFQQYGKGRQPSAGLLESTLVTGWMPTLLRAGRGMTLWEKSRKDGPARNLELFSYENNPYARLVREALCELELPYILQNVAKGSAREPVLLAVSGSREVPFLVDPNTGEHIGDHKKIISYLFHTYSMANV